MPAKPLPTLAMHQNPPSLQKVPGGLSMIKLTPEKLMQASSTQLWCVDGNGIITLYLGSQFLQQYKISTPMPDPRSKTSFSFCKLNSAP